MRRAWGFHLQRSWLADLDERRHRVPVVLFSTTIERGSPLATIGPDRETQILDAASRGLTVRETGAELFLAVDTVKTYRRRVLRRTGTHNMAQAVALWAAQRS